MKNYGRNRNERGEQCKANQHKANQQKANQHRANRFLEELASEIHIVPEEFGFLALKPQKFMGKGMFYHHEPCMEAEPSKGVGTGTVAMIACHRVMSRSELRADFVLSAGFQGELEECVAG